MRTADKNYREGGMNLYNLTICRPCVQHALFFVKNRDWGQFGKMELSNG